MSEEEEQEEKEEQEEMQANRKSKKHSMLVRFTLVSPSVGSRAHVANTIGLIRVQQALK